MSFEDFEAVHHGSRVDLIDAWAENNLPPRKRRDGSISVAKERECSTIYSYAVPIASIWLQSEAPQYALIGTQRSLSRTSVTTNRHLAEVESALSASRRAFHTARIISGKVPSTGFEWTVGAGSPSYLKFFELVHAPNLSVPVKVLWDEFERSHDKQVWAVLFDAYAAHGWGVGVEGIRLEHDGFHLEGADVILRSDVILR